MTAALAARSGLPGELLDNGYVLPPDLTYDEWAGVLKLTEHIVLASPWWLADAMAYGVARFGEQHTQALPTAEDDPDGISQARLKQAGWMADRWPRGTRVPGQSYSAHRVVAKFDHGEAVALLEMTDHDGRRLSTRALVDEVKRREQAITAPAIPVETVCAADAVRTAADFSDDTRAWVGTIAGRAGVLPEIAARVMAATLDWLDCEHATECFTITTRAHSPRGEEDAWRTVERYERAGSRVEVRRV